MPFASGPLVAFGLIGLLLLGAPALVEPQAVSNPQTLNPCLEFDDLHSSVRDQRIDHAAAHARIQALLPRIRAYYYVNGGKDDGPEKWRFPLTGYGAADIGGRNGSGYITTGYNYLDGFKSTGHPGHDIFIHDRDQDTLDDVTGKPVDALSIANGIVVASSNAWQPGNPLRGGRYAYVYSPAENGIFYYAHNESVLVKPCDIVTAGQAIARVGRSGKNAFPPRSPTHLHVMLLKIDPDGYPRPRDIYHDLLRTARARR